MRKWGIRLAVLLLGTANLLVAENYFVDNTIGRDQNDGLSPEALNAHTGPVRSIRRALELVNSGDTVVVANTGKYYYESISLVGSRMSGVQHVPLTILGNGATLSGLRQVPRDGWRRVSEGLWQISFNRKGYYRLLLDGLPVPEHQAAEGESVLETLPPGQWCAFRGSLYYRQVDIDEPPEMRFDFAADEMGITLFSVEHVRIVDLNVEHFRVDGINAHNLCREIVLENVVSRQNGRAGLAVGGASSVLLRQGQLSENGRESALITGKGRLEIEDADLDVEPTVQPRSLSR